MAGVLEPVIHANEIIVKTLTADKINLDAGGLYAASLTANATATVTISNVAPAAVGTATISAWLEIDVAGTKYYIPCWT